MNLLSKLNTKNIFLFDGLGAMASLMVSGLVLPFFSEVIGIPIWILYGLAIIAFFYGCFSFGVYFLSKTYRPEFLLTILFGNSAYCILSMGLIVTLPEITTLGKIVLLWEIAVVCAVIFVEGKVFWKAS